MTVIMNTTWILYEKRQIKYVLIYSITRGMGPECSIFHKHLANKIAEKTGNK